MRDLGEELRRHLQQRAEEENFTADEIDEVRTPNDVGCKAHIDDLSVAPAFRKPHTCQRRHQNDVRLQPEDRSKHSANKTPF